eukprot:TRINITY_DN4569_c0_g1_i1.p1 TRINITY_DN4569_c0_g1~~TRINITY_DN4569_c0_g1_i1.p1  ORF type:complete len:230 (+),score=31.17 TRINITY_DN4569_c0_g1_i1:755-1444(+)
MCRLSVASSSTTCSSPTLMPAWMHGDVCAIAAYGTWMQGIDDPLGKIERELGKQANDVWGRKREYMIEKLDDKIVSYYCQPGQRFRLKTAEALATEKARVRDAAVELLTCWRGQVPTDSFVDFCTPWLDYFLRVSFGSEFPDPVLLQRQDEPRRQGKRQDVFKRFRKLPKAKEMGDYLRQRVAAEPDQPSASPREPAATANSSAGTQRRRSARQVADVEENSDEDAFVS